MRALFLLLFSVSIALGQSPQEYAAAFERAGAEFGVPADILKGIAFSETRWTHLQWSEGDTISACNGMPRLYGIMGLWDNKHFGRTLAEGAALIGKPVDIVKRDYVQNIRAGAALLKRYRQETGIPAEYNAKQLESWYPVIARHCGIPQPELALSQAHDVLSVLEAGYNQHEIVIEPHVLQLDPLVKKIETHHAEATVTQSVQAQPDYPGAKWVSAYPGTGAGDQHWYTSGTFQHLGVVIHYMEGYYLGTISYFQMSTTNASSHYCVKGAQIAPAASRPAGEVTQMVEDQYAAWHAVCLNRYTIGIENEGFTGTDIWWTPEFYQSLANLVKFECSKWSIPKDRNHVIGHNEWQNSAWVNWAVANGFPSNVGTCNSHTDPGPLWDWTFFMQLVTDDPTPPKVTSIPATGKWNVSNKITLTFSQRMEPTSTGTSFAVSPPVAGTVAWSGNNKTLTFTPTTRFEYNTAYTVTLSGTAHNYLNHGLDGNSDGIEGDDYQFGFMTVERDSIPPSIIQMTPVENQVLPSPQAPLSVTFSEFLDATSAIVANFSVTDNVGDEVARTVQHWKVGTKSGVNIWFFAPLTPGIQYTLTVQNVRDLGGNSLPPVSPIHFKVAEAPTQTTVIEPFDAALSSWSAPGNSGSTVGTVPESTTFAFSSSRLVPMIAGNAGSGQINYAWNSGAASWMVREYLSSGTPRSILWSKKGTKLQVYLFGDGSGTNFRFAIDDSVDAFPAGQSANHEVSSWIPVTWVGWKLVEWDLEKDPAGAWLGNGILEGQLRFDSFQLRPGSPMTNGTLYFDQLQLATGTTTDVAENSFNQRPQTTRLLQNYPNPFNPTTTIRYHLPALQVPGGQAGLSAVSDVTLKVYDLLGREVAMLINGTVTAGTHQATWNAENAPAGVYICRLSVGAWTESRKLVLLK